MTGDAFGTAALRAAVLEAWRASPARLREDANTEEDHARGYYRDRVLVELAQNASDAAARAGVPGRLLFRLAHADGRAVLVAANTGERLTAEGVASLASMRASAKRDGRTVGRFGVGFAAVRAVSDEVAVLSAGGGVRFSLADTAGALATASADVPVLADEVRRRDGSLPADRLPAGLTAWPQRVRVLTQAARLRAIVGLAAEDEGGAVNLWQSDQRSTALREVDRLARRAMTAASARLAGDEVGEHDAGLQRLGEGSRHDDDRPDEPGTGQPPRSRGDGPENHPFG